MEPRTTCSFGLCKTRFIRTRLVGGSRQRTQARCSLSQQMPIGDHADASDRPSGTVYVLRSRSDHPEIASRRDLIHKIGVTGGKVPRRITNAKVDPTYLL